MLFFSFPVTALTRYSSYCQLVYLWHEVCQVLSFRHLYIGMLWANVEGRAVLENIARGSVMPITFLLVF